MKILHAGEVEIQVKATMQESHFSAAEDRGHTVQIGLEFLVDHRGNDPTEWAVTQIFYNGQVFANTTELNTAFMDTTSGLNRLQVRPGSCGP